MCEKSGKKNIEEGSTCGKINHHILLKKKGSTDNTKIVERIVAHWNRMTCLTEEKNNITITRIYTGALRITEE